MTEEDEEFNRIEREAIMRTEAVRATVTPRKWVGLTDEERQHILRNLPGAGGPGVFADAIEAKLKEKNT